MNRFIKDILNNTLFLAKTLDFFEDFRTPGKDYKIIACQASEEVAKKYPDVYVDEMIKGKRTYITSKRLLDILQYSPEFKKYVDCKYVWTYQAYAWTNDLKYSGKTVLGIDYYLYMKLQNKLTQRKLLTEYASMLNEDAVSLKTNLLNSSTLLKTQIFPKQKHEYEDLRKIHNKAFVVCASNSNGGEGVFKISNKSEYYDALKEIETPVIRTESYLENGIPLNQIGFILNNGEIIKYKPSVQIIKDIHLSNKMEYAGCDFLCEDYLSNSFNLLTNLTQLTHSIGRILFQMGYRGTFGCDYLIIDENIHFMELNPRYQASTLIPNLHLGKEEILAPHILHLLGFVTPPIDYLANVKGYFGNNVFIDFVRKNKPIGFLNIYNEETEKIRTPHSSVKIEEGLSKGYLLFNKSILDDPLYPAKIDFRKIQF